MVGTVSSRLRPAAAGAGPIAPPAAACPPASPESSGGSGPWPSTAGAARAAAEGVAVTVGSLRLRGAASRGSLSCGRTTPYTWHGSKAGCARGFGKGSVYLTAQYNKTAPTDPAPPPPPPPHLRQVGVAQLALHKKVPRGRGQKNGFGKWEESTPCQLAISGRFWLLILHAYQLVGITQEVDPRLARGILHPNLRACRGQGEGGVRWGSSMSTARHGSWSGYCKAGFPDQAGGGHRQHTMKWPTMSGFKHLTATSDSCQRPR